MIGNDRRRKATIGDSIAEVIDSAIEENDNATNAEPMINLTPKFPGFRRETINHVRRRPVIAIKTEPVYLKIAYSEAYPIERRRIPGNIITIIR
jgi:hypothetical protein